MYMYFYTFKEQNQFLTHSLSLVVVYKLGRQTTEISAVFWLDKIPECRESINLCGDGVTGPHSKSTRWDTKALSLSTCIYFTICIL